MPFRVFTATTPLFSSGQAKLLDKAIVNSFRDEVNALGAASIELLLQNYSSVGFIESLATTTLPFKVGDWVAIQDTEKIEPPDLTVARPEIAQAQYDREMNQPQSTDASIVWWGYISSFQQEYAKDFKDYRGTLNCYQFGHFLRSQQIDLRNTYKIGVSNESGFNPIMDNGVILGNFNGDSDHPGFAEGEMATNPSTQASQYWKVKDAFRYLAKNCSPYSIDVDLSGIDSAKHPYLDALETMPSYQGQDLISVIDDMLEPLKIAFRITSTSRIDAYIIDTSAPITSTIYVLSPSVFNLQVTSEEQKYDKVVLRGDRILVSASMTTYKDNTKGWGLKRKWSNTNAIKYTKPLTFLDAPANTKVVVNINDFTDAHAEELAATVKDLDDDKAKQRAEESAQDMVDYLLKTEDTARKKDKITYQQFGWDFADSNGSASTSGAYLFTCQRPGDISFGNIFPVFPHVEFQKYYDEDQIVISNTIANTILPYPKIQSGNTTAGQGEVTTTLHNTPPISEFKFEDWIPVQNFSTPDQQFTGNANKNRPTQLYARSVGIPTDFNGKYYLNPVWYDITSPSFNSYSGEVELSWMGMKLNLPYPEVMGCPYDDIFRDPISKTAFSSIVDYGFQRNEWEGGVGASRFDPYRTNYIGKTHWGRLVLSFSAYSNQKLELSYGKSSGKVKIIEDDSYKCYILRKGLVYDTNNYHNSTSPVAKISFPYALNGLNYLTDDVVTRTDVPLMTQTLKILYDYYTKDKKALRVEDRVYDGEGKSMDMKVKVGDFWSKIKEGTATLNTNSYVSSVEYLLEKTGTPRVIISTEYPSSPIKTRRRQIRWGSNLGNWGARSNM